MWGEEDRIIPVGQKDTWQKTDPGSKLLTYKGAGHLVLDEKAEAVKGGRRLLRVTIAAGRRRWPSPPAGSTLSHLDLLEDYRHD